MESKKAVYSVDLNMLPISQKPNDSRVVPLWSKSNSDLRSNEFEIKTNTREERNDQVIENVVCHICDINVPILYFNEHKNSFRHKFNTKIADIALKRLQLFINKGDINESCKKNPSKHYCSECSLVIDSDDEISHKQSIVHRNSIFLEKFLNDFLKFYTSDEQEISDSNEDSKKIEVATDTKQCEDSEKGFDSDKLNNSDTVIISDSKEDGKISEKYLDSGEENEKLDLKALQVEDKVVDGARLKPTKFNFNVVTKISALFEYCMICDQIFAIEKRSLHLNSDLHCGNLLQKLPDEYGIRKVNNTHNHCILCNNYFTNYEIHINSKEHITNFQNTIIPDKYKKTAEICHDVNANKINVNTKSQDSDILKSNESKSSTDTNGHTAPLNNIKKTTRITEEIDECTDKIETGNAVNVKLVHGNAIKTAVPGNATDSKVVDAANANKTSVTRNATNNEVVDTANGKALKTVDKCGRLFDTVGVDKIIGTTKQSENTVKTGSKTSYFCNVCQVQVPNSVNNISEHNKGRSHMLKLRQQANTKVKET